MAHWNFGFHGALYHRLCDLAKTLGLKKWGTSAGSVRSTRVMNDDAARYRRQAMVCLDEARRATRVLDMEAWLKLAEEWMAMAEAAQRQSSYEN